MDFEKKVNKLTFSTGAKYSYIKTDNQKLKSKSRKSALDEEMVRIGGSEY